VSDKSLEEYPKGLVQRCSACGPFDRRCYNCKGKGLVLTDEGHKLIQFLVDFVEVYQGNNECDIMLKGTRE